MNDPSIFTEGLTGFKFVVAIDNNPSIFEYQIWLNLIHPCDLTVISVDDIPDFTMGNDGVVKTVPVTVTDTESDLLGTLQACGAYEFSLSPTHVASIFDYGASTIDFSGTIPGDHSQILTVSMPSRPSVTPVDT